MIRKEMAARVALRRLAATGVAGLLGLAAWALPAHAQDTAGQWVAPERASRRTSPVASSADAVKRGGKIFARECEKCHGKLGHGNGPQAKFLEVRPKNLATDEVAAQSDGALFWKITEGRGPMPQAKLNDADKWLVVQFLRTLARKP